MHQNESDPSKVGTGPASANEPASRQTSERKKNANRENSKHSTGPKTARGKAALRYNALQYGLYSRDVVIRYGAGKEDEEEFDILLEGLMRAWSPKDVMQHWLVREIAEAQWRCRRARRAEVGEIRKLTDTYRTRQWVDSMQASGRPYGQLGAEKLPKKTLAATTSELTRLLALLTNAREQVEQFGYVSSVLQKGLDSHLGKENEFATMCYELSRLVEYEQSKEEPSPDPEKERLLERLRQRQGGEHPDAEECKQKLLDIIDTRIIAIKDFCVEVAQTEALEHQANLLAHSLPPKDVVDKVIRYETAQWNRAEKAAKLLLKLQGKWR